MRIVFFFVGIFIVLFSFAQGFEDTVQKIFMSEPKFSYYSGDSCDSINSDSVKYLWLYIEKDDTSTCFSQYSNLTAITIDGDIQRLDSRFLSFEKLKCIWLFQGVIEIPGFITKYHDLECLIIFPKIKTWNISTLSELTNLYYLGWYQKKVPEILYSIPNLRVLSLNTKPKRISLEKFRTLEKVYFEYSSPVIDIYKCVQSTSSLKEIEISYFYNYLQYDELKNFLMMPSLLKLEINIYSHEIAINNQKLYELKMLYSKEGKQLVVKRLIYSHNSEKKNEWIEL
ncbi:hypothetical protein SDC9_118023 [bioreactor metagenome]|uniref:Internalin-A n=1 Tax=bioreactor metagenome TaxID=1076179 RepID=A0A645BZW2_9ZZZZ